MRAGNTIGRSWPLVPLAALVLLAGCGTQPADQEDAPEQAGVQAVAFTRLSGFLPAPAGWTRAAPIGGQIELPDPPRSSSGTSYTRDSARIDMEIVDTTSQQEYVESTQNIAGTNFERVVDNGYFRGSHIGGFPAVESWNHEDRISEITVLILGRFIVHATGSGLDDIAELREFVELVDLDGVAALEAR